MVSIAICDDVDIQLDLIYEILEDYLKDRKTEGKITRYKSGEDLIEGVKKFGNYDIYILDMIMPGINGLETAALLRVMGDKGKIIFLTASVEYAVMSYDVNAFYYLLKPVDTSKINYVLDCAIREITYAPRTIVIKSGGSDIRISLERVMYIDIEDRCPRYHMRDGRVITDKVIRSRFSDMVSSVLDSPKFYMCGLSMVINADYIDTMDSEKIILSDGTKLYPSKSGISTLRHELKMFH